jgi:hypothetical protein
MRRDFTEKILGEQAAAARQRSWRKPTRLSVGFAYGAAAAFVLGLTGIMEG